MMKSRIMEAKIKLTKSMMTSENELVREVVNRVLRDEGSKWNKLLRRYMEEVGMDEKWRQKIHCGSIRGLKTK